MQNKTSELPLYSTMKRLKIPNVGKDLEEKEPSYITSKNLNGTAAMENIWAVFSMSKIQLPYNSVPRYLPKSKENICPQNACTQMFIGTLFLRAQTGNTLHGGSINWWIRKITAYP